jgi:hypothetical protein
MKKRKLKFNSEIKPFSSDSYISEPSVIEAKNNYRRLVFNIRSRRGRNESGDVIEVLTAESDSRVFRYNLDKNYPAVDFNEKSGTAVFTSDGTQYKIRALQEDDKSWIINFSLPEETENS